MKILHVIISLNIGGAEKSMLRLIEAHKNNSDYDHSVVSLTGIGEIGKQLQVSNIRVHALGLKSAFNTPRVMWALMKIIRQADPDVIHTWMYHADLIGGVAGKLTKKKIIWSVRNTHAEAKSGIAKTTFYIMKICAFLSAYIPNKIICVAGTAMTSHVKYGYQQKKMQVIQNGYDVNNLRNLSRQHKQTTRKSIGLAKNATVIGTVGRYNNSKDHPTFIRAAKILLRSNDNLQFLLIGKGINANNTQLFSLIADTGHIEKFFLLDERDDVPALLTLMDIFCLHSISEGFPNVLGEAMCIGLPCITTDVGDAALMVGENGVVVPHSQPELLVKGLQAMVNLTAKERKESGEKLRQRIDNNYSLAQAQHAIETVYQNVLNQ